MCGWPHACSPEPFEGPQAERGRAIPTVVQLAIIGDIHALWSPLDTAYFNASDVHGLLCVGDLPGRNHRQLPTVAKALSGLTKPTLVLPGNHDGPGPLDVLAEGLFGRSPAFRAAKINRRLDRLTADLSPAQLTGYRRHTWSTADHTVDVIAGRPLAMDGRFLSFRHVLESRHGVRTLDESTDRLCALVDTCAHPIVFLAHNGPAGFGANAHDPWGLSIFGRDNGDTDLQRAIGYAIQTKHDVQAVVAGHMHHNSRRPRSWQRRVGNTLYVNAARVPRIQTLDGTEQRHYVRLTLGDGAATAEAGCAQRR